MVTVNIKIKCVCDVMMVFLEVACLDGSAYVLECRRGKITWKIKSLKKKIVFNKQTWTTSLSTNTHDIQILVTCQSGNSFLSMT